MRFGGHFFPTTTRVTPSSVRLMRPDRGNAPMKMAKLMPYGSYLDEKVRGTLKYHSDMELPGMLFMKTVRSPHPHALIKSIDTSRASRVPGVHSILTAKDVPGNNLYG